MKCVSGVKEQIPSWGWSYLLLGKIEVFLDFTLEGLLLYLPGCYPTLIFGFFLLSCFCFLTGCLKKLKYFISVSNYQKLLSKINC